MSLLEQIAAAGVVGCGGAGFPTHVKLKGTFEYLIVNGAECEPMLRNDRWLMRHKARELVEATAAIARELTIPHALIALKHDYEEELAALRAAIAALGAPVSVHELGSFYPAGDEQTIVCEVTGRIVPPAGLPSEVGAVVDNAATVYAVYEAMQGKPFTHKYLTVTGAVRAPKVLRVPVGTPLLECIALAGGALREDYFVVTGGPMMGKSVPPEELPSAVVTKTTSGILVLPPDGYHASQYALDVRHMLNRAKSACIQCTTCTQLCPRHNLGHPLRPHRIMRKLSSGVEIGELLDDPDLRAAQLCCECGVCEVYACPMGLQPRRINAMVKRELAAAGIRYERPTGEWTANEQREARKAPSERIAYRLGVHDYYHTEITELAEAAPQRVSIPLKMNVGAPSVPVVTAGTRVRAGELIARAPDGALGANIHASIDGTVTSVGAAITIEEVHA